MIPRELKTSQSKYRREYIIAYRYGRRLGTYLLKHPYLETSHKKLFTSSTPTVAHTWITWFYRGLHRVIEDNESFDSSESRYLMFRRIKHIECRRPDSGGRYVQVYVDSMFGNASAYQTAIVENICEAIDYLMPHCWRRTDEEIDDDGNPFYDLNDDEICTLDPFSCTLQVPDNAMSHLPRNLVRTLLRPIRIML